MFSFQTCPFTVIVTMCPFFSEDLFIRRETISNFTHFLRAFLVYSFNSNYRLAKYTIYIDKCFNQFSAIIYNNTKLSSVTCGNQKGSSGAGVQ